MTARLTRPFTAFEAVMLCIRCVILTTLLIAAVPVILAHGQDAQSAVNSEKIKQLETSNAALIAQNSSLQERVSRIEGVGIGLGALTSVQLFLQLGAHITLSRKRKGA